MRPVILCFSGLDPSGGAGLQADIETVAALGAHAAVICTALTQQDSQKVYGFETVSPAMIAAQARIVAADFNVSAIKIGMVGCAEIAAVIFEFITDLKKTQPHIPVVLDPVLAANSGGALAAPTLNAALLRLFPLTTVITPNTIELHALANTAAENIAKNSTENSTKKNHHAAIHCLLNAGAAHIFLKGGHEAGSHIVNHLHSARGLLYESHTPRLHGEFHGSGCTMAAAIATYLAQGCSLENAVAHAEQFVNAALTHADSPHAHGQRLPRRVLLPFSLP